MKKVIKQEKVLEIARKNIINFDYRDYSISRTKPKYAHVFNGLSKNCWYVIYSHFTKKDKNYPSIISSDCIAIDRNTGEVKFNGCLHDEG